MSDQMSRRSFMGAAATGAVALAGITLAGCSSTSASSEKSSEKEKAVKPVILVTSFGTSYNDSRHITIGAIEDAIREKYWQDYDIRRAFTAQIIIDKLKKRDGITIDNMTEALDRCVKDGVKEIVVQPTHLMGGLEYTDVKDELDKYADKFDKISLGDPLLTSDDDYKKVAAAIKENMASFDDGKTALCLMGHGTEADSNADYAKMQEVFKNEGLTQFFVGTVEAEPTCEDVIAAASAAGYKKAVLAPFMVVAGDHANNDMADETDPDSWAAKFVAAGFEVTCLLQGLGQNVAVDDIYVSHVDDAIAKVNAWLESAGVGKGTVSYRLRDWLFSRQRYWGEPFPIVYGEDGTPHLLPDEQLPINLPDVPDYSPKTFDPEDAESNPEAPLSRNEDWVKVELDLGDGKKTYYRDTNTMPNWAGSCWYYMRYLDPTDTKHMVEKDEFDYWMGPDHNKTAGKSGGVDLYIGGVEHAVLHLLYSRFWHKVLFDLGYVDSMEPFHKLFNQGMIQAYAYTDDRGQYVPAAEVVEGPADANGEPTFTWNGQHANREFGKMGKSLKNIITPDDMYENYGADTFRLYEMGMGPLAESRPWNTRNVVGSMRFLQRLWRNVIDETTGEVRVTDGELDTKTLKLLNNTIADVTVEMEAMRPNTAIAKLIVLNNHLTSLDAVPRAAVEPLILMLSPIAPHICEELWSKLGHTESLAHADWPKADERYVGQDSVTAVVQIKGKVRAKLEVSPDIDPKELEKMALEAVADRLGGKEPRKVIVKAPKIVSIVPAE